MLESIHEKQISRKDFSKQPVVKILVKWLIFLFVAAGVSAAVGWWAHISVEKAVKKDLRDHLQTILNTNVVTLRIWLKSQIAAVDALAADSKVRACIQDLVAFAKEHGTEAAGLRLSEPLKRLRKTITALGHANGPTEFLVVEPTGINVGSIENAFLGQRTVSTLPDLMTHVLSGKTLISLPFRDPSPLPDEKEAMRSDRVSMFAASPVRGKRQERIIAVLVLRIDPHKDFMRILRVARFAQSGETYAFDGRGRMISQTRFNQQLKQIGLLGDEPDTQAILNVQIRDPGGNLLEGFKPKAPRAEQPLTRMAVSAVSGKDGVDVEEYRDFRGVPVIGAWTWLSEFGFGVAVELDVAEGYQTLTIVRKAFFALLVLFGLAILGVLLYALFVFIKNGRSKAEVSQVQRLGQYTLEEKVGGTLGEVYRASHMFMRRPTILKLVHPERTREEDILRFRREVRLTSRLTHPNTIRIYDYGFTDDGIFYYAMEYLKGAELIDIIKISGPFSEARTIHILLQACGSLREAHGLGLIHRDIKPENLMLCQRGGMYDFVKVLDFGLIKDIQTQEQEALTNPKFAVGTPRYLPPEAIKASDQMGPPSDLFSLGAVGYFMLTACELFETDSVMDIIHMHLTADVKPPSERVGLAISSDLENLILKCLEKNPADRPQSADELANGLRACQDAGKWSENDARIWWEKFGDRIHAGSQDRPLGARQHSVIIVDDEESIRTNLAAFLEDEGFMVDAAATAEDALHILATKKIDFGIIDLRLPNMDGNTLILKAHELQPDMKFVVHTGSMDYTLPRKLLNIGIGPQQIFVKPLLDMNLLVRAIKNLTGKKKNPPTGPENKPS
jgi:serine/threonine protein kinase